MGIALISPGISDFGGPPDVSKLAESIASFWNIKHVSVDVILPYLAHENCNGIRSFAKRVRLKYLNQTKDYNIWKFGVSPLQTLYFIEKSLYFGAKIAGNDSLVSDCANIFFNSAAVNTLKLFDQLPDQVVAIGWQSALSIVFVKHDSALADLTTCFVDCNGDESPSFKDGDELPANFNLGQHMTWSQIGVKFADRTSVFRADGPKKGVLVQ